MSPFQEDRKAQANFELGSYALLAALWREHPEIMRCRGAVKP